MRKITITHNSTAITRQLTALARAVSPAGLRGALREMGEDLAESTRRRFVTSTAPDGSRWAPNAASTYAAMVSKSDLRRDGRLRASSARKLAGKRPLVREGHLADSITYQMIDGGVEIGTSRVYAATHQYGARKGQYGRTRRGAPIPWGDIPARPFLGLSAEDERKVLDIIDRHLRRAASGR